MAKKEANKNPTRKQLVGSARDKALNRTIFTITGIILAIVVGLVGWGLVRENIVNPGLSLAVVEGKEITGEEFQARVRVNRQQLVDQYLQNFDNYQLFAAEPGFQQQFLNQMSLIQFQLDPIQVGLTTINQLVDDEIIILEAQKLGLEVFEAEIDAELQAVFGYFPNGTPTIQPTATLFATSTLSAAQLAIVTATPTASPIPTSADATAVPTALPTSTPAGSPTPEPTPTVFSVDAYQSQFDEYLALQERELGMTEDALRQLVRVNLYRRQLFDYLTADMPTESEHVWARHILVEDETGAQALLDEINQGADWAQLALDNSLDTSNAESGGDLGWFDFNQMVEPFALAAFDLDIGEISVPIESNFGWHIIQVLGKEMRPTNASSLAQEQNTVFSDFVTGLRATYDWEIFEDKWASITPDEPSIPTQIQLQQ